MKLSEFVVQVEVVEHALPVCMYIYNNVSKYYVHKSIRQYHDHITLFPTSFSSLPSHHMWRYLSSQVVAVLDVEDSSMEQGHIMMTERSVGAFHHLKG